MIFIEHTYLLCVKHCAKHYTRIISLTLTIILGGRTISSPFLLRTQGLREAQ